MWNILMESIVPFDIHNEIKEILIISFISYNQKYLNTVVICCTFINGTQIPAHLKQSVNDGSFISPFHNNSQYCGNELIYWQVTRLPISSLCFESKLLDQSEEIARVALKGSFLSTTRDVISRYWELLVTPCFAVIAGRVRPCRSFN